MVCNEKYNGWTNFETWATYTWLSNDYETYNYIREIINEYDEDYEQEDAVKEFLEDLKYSCIEDGNTQACNIICDIGSLWRIDLKAIVKAFKN